MGFLTALADSFRIPEAPEREIPEVNLFRIEHSDHGSLGIVSVGEFTCYSLELPWRDNRTSMSCIPAGEYTVKIRYSQKYGWVFHVTDVKGRTYILFHSGNWAGDRTKGLHTHSEGCLLLGKYPGWLRGQRAVLSSRPTIRAFMEYLDNSEFKLNITEVYRGLN